MKRLNELIDCPWDISIENIKTDSRKVKPKDLFIVQKKAKEEYILDAIKKGAVAVISEKKKKLSVPLIVVSDITETYFELCKKFYQKDQWNFDIIGVTGTDGKTTTTTILSFLLSPFKNTAYIGTNGVWYKKEKKKTENTTPIPEVLYKYLQELHQKECHYIAMEASSEALLYDRIKDISLKYAIITNISEDHLNVHQNIENYIEAKSKIFSLLKEEGIAILNHDDTYYEIMKEKCQRQIISYGQNEKSTFQIKEIKENALTTTFTLNYFGKTVTITSPYRGIYNIYNLVAAFIVCYLEGYRTDKILSRIKHLKPIPGRGEILNFGQPYQIVLDYAHTTKAIESILDTLRNLKPKRLITVMGSAGGREQEKRKYMGKVALEKSDFVIFTMDDPRYEEVDSIIDDLVSLTKKKNYLRITKRELAIKKALDMAGGKDIVAILGKGRDNYMAIEDKKVSYSDYKVIKNYFLKREKEKK